MCEKGLLEKREKLLLHCEKKVLSLYTRDINPARYAISEKGQEVIEVSPLLLLATTVVLLCRVVVVLFGKEGGTKNRKKRRDKQETSAFGFFLSTAPIFIYDVNMSTTKETNMMINLSFIYRLYVIAALLMSLIL